MLETLNILTITSVYKIQGLTLFHMACQRTGIYAGVKSKKIVHF